MVTSEDGKWKKEYEVTALFSGIPTSYHFENALPVKDKKGNILYYNFQESDAIGNILNWANANEGFNYTGVQAKPEEYQPGP